MVVKRWQIYFLNLNPVVGSEQAGTRPAIVISADSVNRLNQVTVMPLTSMKNPQGNIYPNEVFLPISVTNLPKPSIGMAHQLRTVDKIRLASFVGSLNDREYQQNIEEAIKFQLDLT